MSGSMLTMLKRIATRPKSIANPSGASAWRVESEAVPAARRDPLEHSKASLAEVDRRPGRRAVKRRIRPSQRGRAQRRVSVTIINICCVHLSPRVDVKPYGLQLVRTAFYNFYYSKNLSIMNRVPEIARLGS